MFGGLQQGFRWNATNVGAGTARCRAAFVVAPGIDTGSGKTELCSTNCCDIAARAAADYDDIKLFAHGFILISDCF
jgi:hypothetical protein